MPILQRAERKSKVNVPDFTVKYDKANIELLRFSAD